MSETRYPADLAEAVFSEINREYATVPSAEILTSLFEVMYFSSIKTEEAEPIIFNVVYLDPDNPDPNPPESITNDRWAYVSFIEKIPFNLSSVIKLAKASDPRTSSLALYHDSNNDIYIWGLIDQGNRYHDFVNFESEVGPERPGIFQASLESPGNIVAYIQYQKIAELRVNRIVRRAVDIFEKGPIRDILKIGTESYVQSIKRKVENYKYDSRDHWDSYFTHYWYANICRLILRIKTYHHGGALLFSNRRIDVGLNVKYRINYSRLRLALINKAINSVESSFASNEIFTYIDDGDQIPIGLYLDETDSNSNLEEIQSEIDGCLWFISLLSRIDGLVLINKRFDVRGFGVEIKAQKEPDRIYTCSTQIPYSYSLKEVNYNHFGTRHRSMMKYCWTYPNSVGIVISQDGDVRAMTKYEDSLIIWDNIKLQAYSYISRLKLRRKKRSPEHS